MKNKVIFKAIKDDEFKIGMEIQFKSYKLKAGVEDVAFLYEEGFVISNYIEECLEEDSDAIYPLVLFKATNLIGIKEVFETFTGKNIKDIKAEVNKNVDDLEFIKKLIRNPNKGFDKEYTWRLVGSEAYEKALYSLYSEYEF